MPTPTTPPTATWNPARGVWETDLGGLCGHSELYSGSWPISGTTRAGRAYARPMWAHLTDGSASSSSPGLLPTPTVQDGANNAGPSQWERNSKPLNVAALELLPTPSACVANDGEGTETWLARRERVKAAKVNGNGMGMPLTIAVQLLPTPQATDGQGGPKRLRPDGRTEANHGANLRDLFGSNGAPTPTPSNDGNAA